MFEPKCDWWRKIKWEDKTVLLKGILSIKRKDYGCLLYTSRSAPSAPSSIWTTRFATAA